MSRLGEMFSQTTRKYEKTCVKTFYSNVDLVKTTESYPYPSKPPTESEKSHRLRSPSLPPIRRKHENSNARHNASEEETSGYASDSGNQCSSPDIWKNDRGRLKYRNQLYNNDQYFGGSNFSASQKNPSSNKSFRHHNYSHGQGQPSHHNLDIGHETDFSTIK